MKNRIQEIAFFLVISMAFTSCTAKNQSNELIKHGVEYNSSYNWIANPDMIEHEVDCFYVYPTVSSNSSGSMDIANEEERLLAQNIFIAQASVFEEDTNLFAPFYRQMTTQVKMPEDNPDFLATDTEEFKQGAKDVQAAFTYYIENENQGRPFILAGHSQGTMALIELIKEQFADDDELRKRLVATYFIGYTVTPEDLAQSHLRAAQSETDTGVVISYNTQSLTSLGGPMLMEGAICINPLTWMTDDKAASEEENLGARFYNDATGEFLREIPSYCGAQINPETNALMVEIPQGEELEIGPYSEGVYHRFDYAMFYRNLQHNVKKRIKSFLNN
ncbi:MAG: DUF3089 domain-containing protein [Caldisericia bacterium]|nr:DUF3089 domain-containing protein [Caldisericia bacterium]MDD4614948.1 DUF3089 domain-containing protein [Caldisericia bacterium]